MARGGTGNVVPSVVGAEHIGPEATGDNIEAKRVALYQWNSTTNQWSRASTITPTSNINTTFRSGFASTGTQPDPAEWTLVNDTAGTASTDHLITQGGNSSGASYLRISLSPFVEASQVSMLSVSSFSVPIWPRFGVSISQRISGQEIFVGLVGVDANSSVETTASTADLSITGSTATISSNVATFTVTNHGLNGADRVNIYGCAEPRLNVGPVVVTPVTKDTFTVPCTLANGTYSTTGGFVKISDPFTITSGNAANNGGGLMWENTTVTNASFVTRRNAAKFRSLNSTTGTTTATQTNTAPYTDAFNAAANNELLLTSAEMSYRAFTADAVSTPSGLNKFTQGLPDESKDYKIFIRARNSKGYTMPVARITSIAKTGTTTATVTTDVAHGLTSASFVQIYGVLDQTNFPNLAAQTAVTVVDATTFQVVIGTASTNSSSGGTVWNVQGSTLAPGVFADAVQSVSCSSNVMTLIGSATWATPLPGEFVQVWGMQGSAAQYDGAYKVLRVSTTTLEVSAPGVADFGSISTGGAVFRRTDVRLHFVQTLDYNPLIIDGGRGNSTDINNAVPVAVTNNPTTTTNTPATPSTFNLNSAATTNATSVKTTAGSLFELSITNFSAATKYVKLYNKTSAPTVGTDVPIHTIEVAANSSLTREYGAVGMRFSSGIAYAITGAQADSDTTVVAVGDIKIKGDYL